ncbi:hypothetical protein BJ123_1542 [Rhodopseudomonas thermotolerans]|uniref:DUF5343 domain-containing protein n=2 Tax=Rhodopseudomonas TaxID=1073 RepID=A0A336K6J5_9BRAD|nr:MULTISPECIES: DUF5343 domain-containing protein [Rhodopseudomonas]RED21148.1 hypothetical protein BJ125_1542 [Rhodopseudomonas pentothenatexigens]REF86826.1 hypothetical protein BJ123_1542 [Rhodopseudomonas thermotolerans]SSW93761.1 hypothetical protein SAMN05892882_1542 [Rhodopseudomonas pentothenatexigens]
MTLTNAYVLPTNRIADFFKKIQDGQAPERFTNQLLKDWGFTSTNDRAFIPLLKALGFLTADGVPTNRYLEYRDHSRARQVLGQALKEAYSDIFLIKEHPTTADKVAVEGKFKSFHNQSDNVAGLMTKTFFGLLALADINSAQGAVKSVPKSPESLTEAGAAPEKTEREHRSNVARSFHYNIQIHLPATKDVEVYNAIFKSLKDHLLD